MRGCTSNKELITDPKVLAKIHSVVEEVNSKTSPHENIKREKIVCDEWTTANNMLSQTLKLKRARIMSRYAGLVNEIYK